MKRSGAVLFATVLVVSAAFGQATVAGADTASSATCTWTHLPPMKVMFNTYPSTGRLPVFAAVSAASATDAWAVGYFSVAGPAPDEALAYHWKGSRWTEVPAGKGVRSFSAVADIGPGNAWAIGYRQGASGVWHWDGQTWAQVVLPDPVSGVTWYGDVSASRSRDVWVSSYDGLLHWDGSTWTNMLVGVSVRSVRALGPRDVWVQTSSGLMHFDGSTWSTIRSGYIDSFSLSSSTDVWIHTTANTFERWDGAVWTPIPLDSTPYFGVVAPFSADDAWAITKIPDDEVIYWPDWSLTHWDGSTWTYNSITAIDPGVIHNPRPLVMTTVPGSRDLWVIGMSGGQWRRPMFLKGTCA